MKKFPKVAKWKGSNEKMIIRFRIGKTQNAHLWEKNWDAAIENDLG